MARDGDDRGFPPRVADEASSVVYTHSLNTPQRSYGTVAASSQSMQGVEAGYGSPDPWTLSSILGIGSPGSYTQEDRLLLVPSSVDERSGENGGGGLVDSSTASSPTSSYSLHSLPPHRNRNGHGDSVGGEGRNSQYAAHRFSKSYYHDRIHMWDSFHASNKASTAQSLYNVLCTMAGTGVLQLPFAVAQSGWVGILLLVAVALMCNYTAKSLVRCMYPPDGKKLRTYDEIGRYCFGNAGGQFVLAVQCITLVGVCTLFLILIGTNMTNIVPSLCVHKWILVAVAVIWPLLFFKTLRDISLFSLFGFVATITVSVSVVIVGSIEASESVSPTSFTTDFWSITLAFSTFAFSFGGHAVLPSIEGTMSQPWRFGWMMNASYVIVLLLYIPSSIAGYVGFGIETKSPILINFGTGIASVALSSIITLHVVSAYPILLNPVARMIELQVVDESRCEWLWRIVLRTGLLILTALIAIMIPFFENFMALLGSLFITCLVFIFPVLFNIIIHRGSFRWYTWTWNILIIVFGVLGGCAGGYYALRSLIQQFEDNPPNWGDIF